VKVEGIDPGKVYEYLWTRHRIITSPIKHPEVEGIRVTPTPTHSRHRHVPITTL
jgi:hypothetical protein